LEKIQKTAAQPIEIQDEPLEEQGELPEENVKQSEAGANQPEEGIEGHDQSHRKETIEQEGENAQPMSSPLQDPPEEEELAAVLANMG